jgi:hypothetical protein
MMGRNSQSVIDTPAITINPSGYGVFFESRVFGPINKVLGFAVVSYKHGVSSVFHLIRSTSPPTIFRSVVFVVVCAIQAVSRRGFSHIFQKVFKRVKPSFTDFNSTTTISLVTIGSGVKAAPFHVAPNHVNFGRNITSCMPMRGVPDLG